MKYFWILRKPHLEILQNNPWKPIVSYGFFPMESVERGIKSLRFS